MESTQMNKQRDMALYHLKATGEFHAAVHEWEQKPTANKMWANINHSFQRNMQKRTSKINSPQSKFLANAIQEQTEAMETLTEAHTQQMETLVKSTTEAM
jgi:hypothetical protein